MNINGTVVECAMGLHCNLSLLFAVIEDFTAIMLAAITKLPAAIDRVDTFPEKFHKCRIADFLAVKGNLNPFGVACAARGNLFVGRVFQMSANISRANGNNPIELFKITF